MNNGGQSVVVPRHRTTGIAGNPDADTRQMKGQKQFTGYILSGYASEPALTGDPLPTVGTTCTSGQNTGTWTSVVQIAYDGGLYANYNGSSAKLNWPTL